MYIQLPFLFAFGSTKILLCEAMTTKQNDKKSTSKTSVLPPIRVTEEERDQLLHLASAHGLNLSEYLRQAGLAQELRGRAGIEAVVTLSKINADQARLGNLFKLALDGGAGDTQELTAMILEIRRTQQALNEAIDRL